VLRGSLIAQMEGLLAERNPLYGRQTLAMDVQALALRDAAVFFRGTRLKSESSHTESSAASPSICGFATRKPVSRKTLSTCFSPITVPSWTNRMCCSRG
jgi:hypothetical protein